jgi:hypothetical protein
MDGCRRRQQTMAQPWSGMGFAKDLSCTMTASNRCVFPTEIVEIGVQAFDL